MTKNVKKIKIATTIQCLDIPSRGRAHVQTRAGAKNLSRLISSRELSSAGQQSAAPRAQARSRGRTRSRQPGARKVCAVFARRQAREPRWEASHEAPVRVCLSLSLQKTVWKIDNDPSAGSPTETLLRLLLPLNAQVWESSRTTMEGNPPKIQSKYLTKTFNR